MANKQQDETMRTAAEWWVRLRESDASGGTVEQWLQWTGEDPRHLEAFEQVSALAERLGHLDQVSRGWLTGLFAQPARPRRRWLPLAAVASVAAVLLSGTIYVGRTRFGAGAGETVQVYQSGIAQNRDLTLPDGTKVALGAASSLTVRYRHDQRSVTLRSGEAFFEVVHDDRRPFVVTAGKIVVRDIGTAFDVRRTDERVTVTVTQGRVAINDAHASRGRNDTLEAGAGQRVSYDPAAWSMAVDSVETAQATAWRDDRLEFIDEPLSVVVANLNRYASKPLHIADADLGKLSYTGSIRTDAIDSWVGALPEVFPLQVHVEPGRVVLSDVHSAHR